MSGTRLAAPPPARSHRRTGGPRTRRRKALEKQRQQRRIKFGGLTVLGGAAVLVLGALILRQTTGFRFPGEGPRPGSQPSTQQAWLLVGTREAQSGGPADWLNLMSWDPGSGSGFMMYVPRSTIVEVPGHGQATLAESFALGKAPLLESSLANLLGIQFDHVVQVSDQAVRALIEKAGGVEINVENRLTREEADGRSHTIFAEGLQHLNGERAAEYLTFVDSSGDEISRAVRHVKLWEALWAKYRENGGEKALGALFGGSKDILVTDAPAEDLQKMFGVFAGVGAQKVQFETMPVRATGLQTGSQLYGPDRDSIESIVKRYLAGVRPKGAGRAGRRVEILNGNGKPGVGQEVSDSLIPKGFRIVLNQNAKRFDYTTTQIVVYSRARAALATAGEIRDILGVGEVVVSRQRQSLVDVTIVLGSDYLRTER